MINSMSQGEVLEIDAATKGKGDSPTRQVVKTPKNSCK